MGIYKRIYAAAFSVLLCMLAVKASAKEISYDSLNVSIDLKSDGSALISETWTVLFSDDKFTSFSKPIDCDMEQLKNVEVVLDGVQCAETENGNEKPVWTYQVDKKDGDTFIECYFNKTGGTHTLDLRYVVKNLVSISNKAELNYSLVNDDFDGNIPYADILINFPYSVSEKDITVEMLSLVGVSGNSVHITGSRVNGMSLTAAVKAPEYIFSEEKQKENVIKVKYTIIWTVVLAAAALFVFIFRKHIKYVLCKAATKYKKMSDVSIAKECDNLLSPADIIRTDKKYMTSKKAPAAAFLWLLVSDAVYCDSFGIIRFNNDFGRALNACDYRLAQSIEGADAELCIKWINCIYRNEKSNIKNDKTIQRLKAAFAAYLKRIADMGADTSREKYVLGTAYMRISKLRTADKEGRLTQYGAMALLNGPDVTDLSEYILRMAGK